MVFSQISTTGGVCPEVFVTVSREKDGTINTENPILCVRIIGAFDEDGVYIVDGRVDRKLLLTPKLVEEMISLFVPFHGPESSPILVSSVFIEGNQNGLSQSDQVVVSSRFVSAHMRKIVQFFELGPVPFGDV